MCSNVAGLMNGPVGDLVAMGVKALIDGASPIGPRCANFRKRQKEPEVVHEFYDSLEAHLRGTLRVLQPALEIKNILMGECRSAGNEKSAPNNGTPIAYYTPQNAKKSSRAHNCIPGRCYGSANKTADKSRNGERSSVDDKLCSRNKCRLKDTAKSLFTMPPDNSAKSESAVRGRTTRNKTSARSVKTCHVCDVNSMDNSMLAVLPCKHVFCYPCLARQKNPKCQKCEKSFDVKNVTSL